MVFFTSTNTHNILIFWTGKHPNTKNKYWKSHKNPSSFYRFKCQRLRIISNNKIVVVTAIQGLIDAADEHLYNREKSQDENKVSNPFRVRMWKHLSETGDRLEIMSAVCRFLPISLFLFLLLLMLLLHLLCIYPNMALSPTWKSVFLFRCMLIDVMYWIVITNFRMQPMEKPMNHIKPTDTFKRTNRRLNRMATHTIIIINTVKSKSKNNAKNLLVIQAPTEHWRYVSPIHDISLNTAIEEQIQIGLAHQFVLRQQTKTVVRYNAYQHKKKLGAWLRDES